MKKWISLIAILSLVFILTNSVYGENATFVYDGIPTYEALYENVKFNDIEKHWAEESIYKMASLSVIRGMGKHQFKPEERLTKEQALILLVRLLGLEGEAYTQAENSIDNKDTGKYQILTTFDYLSEGYIQTALNNNIVTQEEIDDIEELTETETEDIELETEKQMIKYERDLELTEAQLSNIENQLRQKLEKNYTWRKNVSREQVAVWVARALELTPIIGQAQQNIYNLKDWQDIDTDNLDIIEAVLQEEIMQGNTKGYFLPKSSIKRGEMAKLLDNIHEEILQNRGYKIFTGIIERIGTVYDWNNEAQLTRTVFRIENDDNTISELITRKNNEDGISVGFIGLKKGKIITSDKLEELDYIKYYVTPENEIIFAEVLNNQTTTLEGFIKDIDTDNRTITVENYDGNEFKINVSPGADIRVNNYTVELKDLLYGQEVTLNISKGSVIDIDGYLDTGEEGYIHPGERIFIGKVLYKNLEDNELTLLDNQKEKTFIVDPYTPVIKNDSNVGLEGIKEGDIVRLEFDEHNSNMPIKLYVSEPDRQYENLFKATVADFNPSRNQILLKDVSHYDNTEWIEDNKNIILPLNYDTDIYIDGKGINKQYLDSYIGREAYIVTEDNFGKEEALKIVFKNGYEKQYYNSVQNIAFGDRKITVDYNQVYFDDSTIIIKDDKLIHPYNLKEDDDVFVVSHGMDTYTAAFISVEGIEDNVYIVYRGRMDEIGQYNFELDNYDILKGTEWDYNSKQTEFNISDDTKIIDTRDKEVKEVSVKEFTNSRFLKEDDKDNYYREYAYAVEYNDMIIAMNIIDDNDEAQVVTTGKVDTLDKINSRITLDDIRDWSDFEDKWIVNTSKVTLDVSDAIFIKNGKVVTINDISEGNSLYILRENDDGYIVIVR
ncbi:S-layer homology domain-containing protein [Caldisalinibacter kiritimatiensis]|uniref:SLH domain-containing protein n=1 Tax=Caldisalinibacter kiritimatiensis TaxID=1304284 RepID=R1AYR7_9FIRM|nr:S-layer homology domain-containing protein [Caldisalinibacter kiritimatiensis]EOD01857.1 hypothetical protein L21TH_0063 [Caldisalinibacter kiritimatiensis]